MPLEEFIALVTSSSQLENMEVNMPLDSKSIR